MERRQTERAQTCLPATLTVLSEPRMEFQVMVEDLSGAGARIRLDRPVPSGTAVQLSLEDALYLGEVMYCIHLGADAQVGLALRHSLMHTKDLSILMQRLMDRGRSAARGSAQTGKKVPM